MDEKQLQEWRALAEEAPTRMYGPGYDQAYIQRMMDALNGLVAEVERLRSVSGKPQPTDAENEAAAERIRQIDVLYARHGNDTQRWPGHAQDRLLRLNTEQDAYEAAYC
jgi:hypothetical protein